MLKCSLLKNEDGLELEARRGRSDGNNRSLIIEQYEKSDGLRSLCYKLTLRMCQKDFTLRGGSNGEFDPGSE